MWPRRSHILAPLLTELLGTKTYKWSDNCQTAFLQMKAIIARETLLAYPDHNKTFYVETDASDYQLGGRIFQKDVDESGKEVERDMCVLMCRSKSSYHCKGNPYFWLLKIVC